MEKKIREYLTHLGCKSPAEVSSAYCVFLELFDVKLMHDVEFHYNDDIQQVYLTAKVSKNSSPSIFVPHPAFESIDMTRVEKLQNNLCPPNDAKSVTLACLEDDSTIVFYTFSNRLIDPQNPEIFVRQKTREERKKKLEGEIRKNRNHLLLEAYKEWVAEE